MRPSLQIISEAMLNQCKVDVGIIEDTIMNMVLTLLGLLMCIYYKINSSYMYADYIIYFNVPEPTLTVENVVGVLEKVAVERRKEVWSSYSGYNIVPYPQLEEIYEKYSTEEQRIHSACADIYVNYPPNSSWTLLCWGLYRENEMTAAKKAKTFMPQTGKGYRVSKWLVLRTNAITIGHESFVDDNLYHMLFVLANV